MDGLEAGWWVREDVNKVTEEAVRRVQENQKKAHQAAQDIKADKAVNDKLAKFLWFLLQNIKNDKLIKVLYDTFFKVKNPKDGLTYIKKNINTIVIVWMFSPFYPKAVKEYQLEVFYGQMYDFSSPLLLSTYVQYLKKLSSTYHDNVPVDKLLFLTFLTEIVLHYNLTSMEKVTDENYKELQQSLSKELYWSSII